MPKYSMFWFKDAARNAAQSVREYEDTRQAYADAGESLQLACFETDCEIGLFIDCHNLFIVRRVLRLEGATRCKVKSVLDDSDLYDDLPF